MPLLKNWASVPQFWKKYVGVMACVDGPTARWTLPIGRLQISLLPVHVIYTQNRCRFTRNQVNNYSHCEEVQGDFSVPVSISRSLSSEAPCSYMPLSFHDFLCNFDLGMVFMPYNHWAFCEDTDWGPFCESISYTKDNVGVVTVVITRCCSPIRSQCILLLKDKRKRGRGEGGSC